MINTPNSPTLLPNSFITKNITEIEFQEEWRNLNLVIYANGLGKVRDLIGLLPVIKNLNLKFFLDGAKKIPLILFIFSFFPLLVIIFLMVLLFQHLAG
jgi:hypothetical protein